MQKSINRLGLLALVAFAAGMLPGIGWLASILAFILTTILYAKIDRLGYGTHLFNFSLYQWLIILLPTGAVLYWGVDAYTGKSHSLTWLIMAILIALLLFLALVNYFVGQSLLIVAKHSANAWFKFSGLLTKAGAYSMPLLLGIFLIIIAQPFFLIGCITFTPLSDSKPNE